MLNRILPRTHQLYCPDEHQLAAYVDQQLIGAERERVESHLAKCDSCLEQVGFLARQSNVLVESAPSSMVCRAKMLRNSALEGAHFGWKWVSVATATAVIAIGLLVWREARPHTREGFSVVATARQSSALAIADQQKSKADTTVRSGSPTDSQPLVLSPQPGAIVHASDFSIRWEPIPNAAAYEVRVVTADGDLVWRKRVHENSVNPPKQTLRAGLKYFVWVRAWLPNGKTEQSAAVAFIGG